MTLLAPPPVINVPSMEAEKRTHRTGRAIFAWAAVVAAVVFGLYMLVVHPGRDTGPTSATSIGAGDVSTAEMLAMWDAVKLPCQDPLVVPGPPQNRYGLVPTADYPTAGDLTAQLKDITPLGDRAFVAEQLSYLNLVLVQTQGDMTLTDRDASAAIDAAGPDAAQSQEAMAVGQAQLLSDRTAYRKAVRDVLTALSTGHAVDDPSLASVFYPGRTCTGMG